MNYIFIDSKDEVEKIGIVEDDRLVEFYIGEKKIKKLVGNIYRGKVVNVLQGMEAAFVDIGEGKNAYLYVKYALPRELMYKNLPLRINDVIKNGDDIIVQVIKEPSENKGAKITTHITLPGRFLVLTPYSNKINISKKIDEEDEIKRLQEIGKKIQKENIGVIFRTKALGVEKELLAEEYNILISIFKKIEREKNFLPCPKLIYKEMDLANQIIRDVFSDKIHRIIVNDKDKYHSLLEFQDIISSNLKERLFYDKDFNLINEVNIEKEIQIALDRKVFLESGGHIVIDETEALTVIDVNTGKFIGSKNLEDTVVKTNIEAAREISKQIRLRDIGGIIIVDFIDMKNRDDINLVLDILAQSLKPDRNKTNIISITKLGLVELTRKKVRNSLSTKFIKKCSYCGGRGKILDEEKFSIK